MASNKIDVTVYDVKFKSCFSVLYLEFQCFYFVLKLSFFLFHCNPQAFLGSHLSTESCFLRKAVNIQWLNCTLNITSIYRVHFISHWKMWSADELEDYSKLDSQGNSEIPRKKNIKQSVCCSRPNCVLTWWHTSVPWSGFCYETAKWSRHELHIVRQF